MRGIVTAAALAWLSAAPAAAQDLPRPSLSNAMIISIEHSPLDAAEVAAIRESSGKYIVRLDAHGPFPPGYVERCVALLEENDAAGAGGVMWPQEEMPVQKAIAAAMRLPLGVGGEIGALPVGQKFDAGTGTFSRLPGPGFLGAYEIVILREDGSGMAGPAPVKIRIEPGSKRR
jgi:hypothetical protein